MLRLASPPETRREGAVLLFGAGLIGSRIGAALVRRGWRCTEEDSPWHDGKALERRLVALAADFAGFAGRLDVIWSAGRAGFASGEDQTRGEAASFRRILALAGRLAAGPSAVASGCVVFHLVSSAGGLFEGQRHVDHHSEPSPRRPYGVLKLRLEEMLWALDAPLVRRVYRLASVYGPAPRGGRRGLIPTLLDNTRAGRPTTIVGHLGTLRDYVSTEDVARYLADACTAEPSGDRVEILASGKPTSIHEMLHHVRRVVGRTPCLAFAQRPDNATDITFARSALPAAWRTTDLETSIRQLHRGVYEG